MTPISPFINSRSWLFLLWMTRSKTRSGAVPAMAAPSAFSARAQLGVERVDAGRPAVHRGDDEDLGARVEVVVGRQALGGERDDLVADRVGARRAR